MGPARTDDDGWFGEDVAARYDAESAAMFEAAAVDPAVDVLARLAGDDGALELAVGTGRLALPLSRRGVRVHGIDLSAAMLARLRDKPGADAVTTTRGDMTTTRVPGTFGVVYLVFNTVMNLTTQAAQVACFRNAAAHLRPGGCFVVETMVPDLRRLPPGVDTLVFSSGDGRWAYDTYDPATQAMASTYVRAADGRCTVRSVPFRYVWPAELDLMAELAGMRLRHRWADWSGGPFTGDSTSHVSVWERT